MHGRGALEHLDALNIGELRRLRAAENRSSPASDVEPEAVAVDVIRRKSANDDIIPGSDVARGVGRHAADELQRLPRGW